MKTIETKHDGWDCNPHVKRISKSIKSFHDLTYEIECCERYSSMRDIHDDILFLSEELKAIANCLDVNVEYKTIDDEQ
jgi:hypothetical protein